MPTGVELATSWVRLVPTVDGLGPAIGKGLKGLPGMGEQAGRSLGSSITSGLGKVAKVGAIGVGTAIVAGLGTALTKGFGRLKALDEAQAKLTGLGHSAATVETVMSNALASVKGTAFGLGSAATVAAGAIAAGIKPGADLQRTLKAVADTAAIAGTDMESMGAIFNKAAASNEVQMDIINQLHDRGVPALQLIARQLGVTAQEASNMASRGEIDFATFQAALESGVGGAALKTGETFSGAMANVFASLGRIGANLLSGLFPQMTSGLQGIIRFLEPIEDVAKRVGESIGAVTAGIIPGIKAIVEFAGSGSTSVLAEAFNIPTDSPILGLLSSLRDMFTQVWDAVGPLVVEFAKLWSQISPLSIIFQAIQPVLPSLVDAFMGLVSTVGSALGGALQQVMPVLVSLAEVLAGVLSQAIAAVLPIVTELIGVVGPLFSTVLAAVMPLIVSLSGIFQTLLAAIVPLIEPILGLVAPLAELVAAILAPLVELFSALLQPILALIEPLVGFLVPILQFLVDVIAGLIGWIAGAITSFVQWVTTGNETSVFFEAFGQAIGLVFEGIGTVLNWLWTTIFEPVFNAIGVIFNWLWTTIIEPVVGYIQLALQGWGLVVDVVGAKINEIWQGVGTVFNTVRDVIAGAIQKVTDVVNGVKKTFEDVAKGIRAAFDGIGKFISDAFGGIGDFLGGVADTFNNLFGGMGDKARSFKGRLSDIAAQRKASGGPGIGAPGTALARVQASLLPGLTITDTFSTPARDAAFGISRSVNSYHYDRNNPAVDIAGPTSLLFKYAAILRAMGGWRQFLWQVSGHYDHIHVAHSGGKVSALWPRMPGDRWDERTVRLQVGETVLPRSVHAADLPGSDGGAGMSVVVVNKSGAALGDLIEMYIEEHGRRQRVALENGLNPSGR